MATPGYYKTNLRALRLRELIRWYGFGRGIRAYIITRWKKSTGGNWMPSRWSKLACSASEFSNEFWKATERYRAELNKLGFSECGYLKVSKGFYSNIRDNGAVHYISANRQYLASVTYHRTLSNGSEREQIGLSFSAIYDHGSLSCSNRKDTFDAPMDSTVIRVASCDVAFMYEKFLHHVRSRNETPLHFPDEESLRKNHDERHLKTFEERVRRKLFVPMTDAEVAAAQAQMADVRAGQVGDQRPTFRLGWWPLLIIAFAALKYLGHHRRIPLDGSDDTILYHGQNFKMKKAYASYEEFKNDPENLDTNEPDRIEKLMTTLKPPGAFQNREKFMRWLFELKFPGYGLGGLDDVKLADGSQILAESVEIPAKDEDRYIVVQETKQKVTVIDDFISPSATNRIQSLAVQNQKLRFDQQGHLLRETPFQPE